MTNAEARFNKSLRPRKPEGSLGRTAQDVHLKYDLDGKRLLQFNPFGQSCLACILSRLALTRTETFFNFPSERVQNVAIVGMETAGGWPSIFLSKRWTHYGMTEKIPINCIGKSINVALKVFSKQHPLLVLLPLPF